MNTQSWVIQPKLQKQMSISATKSIYKITTLLHLSNSAQLESLFVLKQNQITQRIKNDKSKNHESTGFENRKQMQWFKWKTVHTK